MVRSAWWLAVALTFGCARPAENARPAPEASAPVAAQTPAAPEERALPDAGLTLQPMVPPVAGEIPDQRLEFQNTAPAGAAGFRATQNDTPPPKQPVLRTSDRPYVPFPPKPDSEGRLPVPRQDPGAPTVPVKPKGPASTTTAPADR
ncbi:MAG TPA: hypothetical protein VFN91_11715 [Myxococcaceae bacterium]|nr:hypothetical protein [Myxococcaceae bacterium]